MLGILPIAKECNSKLLGRPKMWGSRGQSPVALGQGVETLESLAFEAEKESTP